MLHIALYQPEIPPNTGNIIRLCANTGAKLHLIHPLGFRMDTKALRRAGLDYREWADVQEYKNFEDFWQNFSAQRIFACTTKAKQLYTSPSYQEGDIFLFGPESRGLPKELLDSMPEGRKIKIPMKPDSRSLNLSNAAAVILYEALRQLKFPTASHGEFPD
jgi:tRNA (cytidine/uridine-2'-O-)-methyltransferase